MSFDCSCMMRVFVTDHDSVCAKAAKMVRVALLKSVFIFYSSFST